MEERKSEKFLTRNCIHTKNVFSLIDFPKKEESYKRMSKHVESCAICSDELQKFQLKMAAAKVFIPKVSIDKELRESFENEVVELFKVMDLNDRELLKRNVKKGFLFLDRMGIDFVGNLVSKTMFKAYILALMIFICLKLFL